MKILAIALSTLLLAACSNNDIPERVHYQEPTYQEPVVVQDDGFGATEFIAGAAIGSLVTNGVKDNNIRKNYTRNYTRNKTTPVRKVIRTPSVRKESAQKRRVDRATTKRTSFKSSPRSSSRRR